MDSKTINITLPTAPVPWQSPKSHRFFDPKAKEKDYIRVLIKQQYRGEILDCPVALTFYFFFEPAKSLSEKKKKALYGKPYDGNKDATNCQKLTEDCLQNIVIKNDRKVWNVQSIALWAQNSSITIQIDPYRGN